MAYLLFPDKELLEASGFASVCHIPFLIDSDRRYLREPSRYLRERALLEWTPTFDQRERSLVYPTITTLKNIGDKLKNFLEWCTRHGKDWREVQYIDHLILGYQRDMDQGNWSASQKALSPRTINQRVSEATLYLLWGAERGLRGPLYVPTSTVSHKISTGTHTNSGKSASIQARAGKAPERPTSLRIPSNDSVGKWLRDVYTQRGHVKGLCSELIVATAIRLRECVEWQVDALSANPTDWDVVGDKVQVEINHGTKGHKAAPDSLIGPSRRISIPLALAKKLHEYRTGRRLVQHDRWVRAGKTKEERNYRRRQPMPRQLFLGEHSNRPFSSRMLRYAWSSVPLPVQGWSPHLGRHYWACSTMLAQLQHRVDSLGMALSDVPGDWLTGTAQSDLILIVRPQLGHLSEETSMLYLQWLRNAANGPHGALSYLDFLEG